MVMSNIEETIKSILSEDKSDNEKSEMIEREILKIFDGLGSDLPLNYQLLFILKCPKERKTVNMIN